MSTVRLAPSRTEVRTVSCTAYTDDAAPKAAEPAEGQADRPCRPGRGGCDRHDTKRPARLVEAMGEASQPGEENGGRSPRDVGLASRPRVGVPSCRRATWPGGPAHRPVPPPLFGGVASSRSPAWLRRMESFPPRRAWSIGWRVCQCLPGGPRLGAGL